MQVRGKKPFCLYLQFTKEDFTKMLSKSREQDSKRKKKQFKTLLNINHKELTQILNYTAHF